MCNMQQVVCSRRAWACGQEKTNVHPNPHIACSLSVKWGGSRILDFRGDTEMSDMQQQPQFCICVGKAGSTTIPKGGVGGGRRMRAWMMIVGLLMLLQTSFLYNHSNAAVTTLGINKSVKFEENFEKALGLLQSKKTEMGNEGSVKWKMAAFHEYEETITSKISHKIKSWLSSEDVVGEASLLKDVAPKYDIYCFVKHGSEDICRPVMSSLLDKFGTTWQVLVVMEEEGTLGGESGCIIGCIVSMGRFEKNPMEVNGLLHPLLQSSSISKDSGLIENALKNFQGDTNEHETGNGRNLTKFKKASFMDGKFGNDMKEEICRELKSKLDAYANQTEPEFTDSYYFEGDKYETHILVKRPHMSKVNCTQPFKFIQDNCVGSQVAVVQNFFCSVAYFTSMKDFADNPLKVNRLIHTVLGSSHAEKPEKKRTILIEKAFKAAYPRPSPKSEIQMVSKGSVTGKSLAYLTDEKPAESVAKKICDSLKTDLDANTRKKKGKLYYQSHNAHRMYMLVNRGVEPVKSGEDSCKDAIQIVTESCGNEEVLSLVASGCSVSYIMTKHHEKYTTPALNQFASYLESPKNEKALAEAVQNLNGKTSVQRNIKFTSVAFPKDTSPEELVVECEIRDWFEMDLAKSKHGRTQNLYSHTPQVSENYDVKFLAKEQGEGGDCREIILLVLSKFNEIFKGQEVVYAVEDEKCNLVYSVLRINPRLALNELIKNLENEHDYYNL